MEMSLAKSSDVSLASDKHYQLEGEIMSHIRNMTLQGKAKLANGMAQHVANAEKEAKQK
jgi:hypothetical protein